MVAALNLRDRDNLQVMVFWVADLRARVSKRMLCNKVGAPLTTDVDVLLATPEELKQSFNATEAALDAGKIVSNSPYTGPSPDNVQRMRSALLGLEHCEFCSGGVWDGGRHDNNCPLSDDV